MATPNYRVLSQYLGLFLLLVVLPAGSWIYLRNGYNYQKQLRSELKDLGVVTPFSLPMTTGDTLTLDSLQDRVAIACFIDSKEAISTPLKMEVIRKMLEQFHDQEIDFLIHTVNTASDSLTALRIFAAGQKLDKVSQCKFLTGEEPTMMSLAKDIYKLPADFPVNENPFFVLTALQKAKDGTKSRVIKGYYDIRNIKEKQKLIEHTVMLLGLVDKSVRGR